MIYNGFTFQAYSRDLDQIPKYFRLYSKSFSRVWKGTQNLHNISKNNYKVCTSLHSIVEDLHSCKSEIFRIIFFPHKNPSTCSTWTAVSFRGPIPQNRFCRSNIFPDKIVSKISRYQVAGNPVQNLKISSLNRLNTCPKNSENISKYQNNVQYFVPLT